MIITLGHKDPLSNTRIKNTINIFIDEHVLISSYACLTFVCFLEEQSVGYLYIIGFILHTYCLQGAVRRPPVLVTLFLQFLLI